MIKKIYKSRDEIDTSKLRAFAEINLTNFKHNIDVISTMLDKNCEIVGVVKANAYGHGALEVASYFESIGIKYLAVACISEAIKLRKGNIKGEIIVLGYTPVCQKEELIEYNLTQTLINSEYAKSLSELPGTVKCHVALNTGMNRIGENRDNLDDIKSIFKLKNMDITGIFSHLCRADSEAEEDILFTRKQIENFDYIIDKLKDENLNLGKVHLQNSYGIASYREIHRDLARPGIILYGVPCDPCDAILSKLPDNEQLKPTMSLRCRVAMVKEVEAGENIGYGNNFTTSTPMKIATITIGYADGFSRAVSKKDFKVLINGQYGRIVGNVCMDQTMVDVTNIDNIKEGDIVTLFGQDGGFYLPVNQLSRLSGTITNETLSCIGSRVERVYHY
ncbi:serine racemase VanT catalytic subunit [Terrisporobacter petrolearius]|uniref:serine racemase VanT catalytic subunit n=1 Tax=Terrisporobacter petrolearius TaxID=1460447 RepID=UPI001D16A781|nr:serine racemase VanT catalytic subunit [Terrisporobacter petrolearius]MCC3864205.1 serine racemase VanT catalytic subunit [Terrisporobacter petrolearius]